jgi:SAM-dependent methyltransferase
LTTRIEYDGGSFKDPSGRVFFHHERVFRTLSPAGRTEFDALVRSGLYAALVGAGHLVPTTLCRAESVGLPTDGVGEFVLEHERIPFITYPYEWSFDMLRDAALLTLTIIERALEHDFTLKDATPFNVQFRRGKPVFIDILSFEPYRAGEPWVGYSQFCSMFLYPLMLTAYRHVEFHPWLRGALGTLSCLDMSRLFGWRDVLRPGVLVHVKLAARFQRSFEQTDVRLPGRFAEIRFSKAAIRSNVNRLRQAISKLQYAPPYPHWARYTSENTYSSEDERAKIAAVEEALARQRPRRVWDLGCNTGVYSDLAACAGAEVVAIDADAASIEALYQAQKAGERSPNIQCLVGDLTNASPAMGWALAERRTWQARGQADFVIALALVHHIVISGNIPVEQFVSSLRSLASAGITEFVTKDDPQVKRLLSRRRDVFTDYTLARFQDALRRHFTIVKQQPNSEGTRVLFQLAPVTEVAT